MSEESAAVTLERMTRSPTDVICRVCSVPIGHSGPGSPGSRRGVQLVSPSMRVRENHGNHQD